MKHFLLALFMIFFVKQAAYSQMGTPSLDELKQMQQRPMVVVLLEEDPARLKKLQKKPTELAAYKKRIATINANMQQILPGAWTYSSEVIFKSETEFKALQKQKSKEFAYLKYELQKVKEPNDIKEHPYTKVRIITIGDEWYTPILQFGLTEKPAHSFVHIQTLPKSTPTQGDLTLALRMTQSNFTAFLALKESGKKINAKEYLASQATKLPSKTLLINKDQLYKGLTEATVKASYPFPFEILDSETIEKRILEADSKYALVTILPIIGLQNMLHQVIDLSSGEQLAYDAPGALGSKAKVNTAYYVSKESLKAYVKDVKK